MALLKEERYTIDDIYALPDEQRAELIHGQIYYMAPPTTKHQALSSAIHGELYTYIKQKGGTCKVFAAPFAVFLNKSETIYVEPDISVICDPSKLDEKGCNGAPDLVAEIVSPSSKRMDYYTKLALYKDAGVREYWIIDPLKEIILVYDMENDSAPKIYYFMDKVKVHIYDDLEIDFSQIIE